MTHWTVEKTPDFILTSLYLVIVIRLKTASNNAFKTPFYTFFFTTGICGIGTVYTNIFAEKIIYTKQIIWIHVISQACAIGSTIGKLMMVMHRYVVIRSSAFAENTWSPLIMRLTVTSQIVIPIICASPIAFHGYVFRNIDGVDVMVAQEPTGVLIQKLVTCVFYIFYIMASLVLTVITGRKLRRLAQLTTETTRRQAMKQQRNMYIIVLSVNQLVWAGTAYLGLTQIVDEIVRPLFPFVNGLATYTAPVSFLLLSPSFRSLFICQYLKRSRVSSTTPTAPTEGRTAEANHQNVAEG